VHDGNAWIALRRAYDVFKLGVKWARKGRLLTKFKIVGCQGDPKSFVLFRLFWSARLPSRVDNRIRLTQVTFFNTNEGTLYLRERFVGYKHTNKESTTRHTKSWDSSETLCLSLPTTSKAPLVGLCAKSRGVAWDYTLVTGFLKMFDSNGKYRGLLCTR
jgi:hypothetical protein